MFAVSPARMKRAFTLIELLVVIAIIAILAAILFPVFAQAREKARQTACLSNCKQIGTGLMMYVQDYDETYPQNIGGGSVPAGTTNTYPDTNSKGTTATYNQHWMQQVYTYTKNWGIFLCPSDKMPLPAYNSAGTPNGSGAPPTDSSYALNLQLMQNIVPSGFAYRGPLTEAQLVAPSTSYIVSETALSQSFFGFRGSCSALPTGGNPAATRLDAVRFANATDAADRDTSVCFVGVLRTKFAGNEDSRTRHSGGENIVYGDGHAKWSKWSNILDKYTCMDPDKAGTGQCNDR